MDPRLKYALLGGASVLAVGSFSVAHAQTQLPLESAVTGNEIVKDNGNPTGGYFTTKQQATFDRILAGHLSVTGSSATVTGCGNSPAISGTDVAGRITFGTGSVSTCTLVFATAYVSAPYCDIRFETGSPSTSSYIVSTTNVAISAAATTGLISDYFCIGQAGG